MHIYKNVTVMERLSGGGWKGGEGKRKMEEDNAKIHSIYERRWHKATH
jgi:hypothetical protein